MKYFYSLLLLLLTISYVFAQQRAWSINPQRSKLAFVTTHLRSNITGYIDQFTAKIFAANPDMSDASIEIIANVYSFNSSVSTTDQRFMAAEFFNVAKYPVMTFKSTSLVKTNVNTYRISGMLELHGVTEYVALVMKYKDSFYDSSSTFHPVSVQISADLDRQLFNIGKTYSPNLIANKMQLIADLEFMLADN
ncbi:MAG TPA: YceI family protein [Ferruginibacter sp.]|nr:YceI family protein [Ferruginibacter sp.]